MCIPNRPWPNAGPATTSARTAGSSRAPGTITQLLRGGPAAFGNACLTRGISRDSTRTPFSLREGSPIRDRVPTLCARRQPCSFEKGEVVEKYFDKVEELVEHTEPKLAAPEKALKNLLEESG